MPVRRILHLDMDAFFASVEQADRPELKGKPVIIAGSTSRGVVSAASYEARKYGVRSAMPSAQAHKLCPHGVYLKGSMDRYCEVSRQIMAILRGYSPFVEQASVDEAFLDATGLEGLFGPPLDLAMRIKRAIREATGLTCSVGIAPVKFLAKIASDYNKPDGVFILEQADVAAFLRDLPVGKIPGVGPRGLKDLDALAVRTVGDVLRYPGEFWESRMGKWGGWLYDRARGIDTREVETHYDPKSESAEHTLDRDTLDMEELKRWMMVQSERVALGLRRYGVKGRTVTLKLKTFDFKSSTRSRTLAKATNASETIFDTAVELLEAQPPRVKIRLVGVGVSNFQQRAEQLSLFENDLEAQRESLDAALAEIREKWGKLALVRGRVFEMKK